MNFIFSGDDRKRGNIAYCLSKLNIKTLSSYRILKENFPTLSEKNKDENEDDYDKEEHLAWKKYLTVNSSRMNNSYDSSCSFFSLF